MTLCITWTVATDDAGYRMFAVSDRRGNCGDTIDFVPKIFSFIRQNCLFCWEGAHDVAFPMLENIRLLLDGDRMLSSEQLGAQIFLDRILFRMNYLWQEWDFSDPSDRRKSDICSFILGAYDYDNERVFVSHIHNVDGSWESTVLHTKEGTLLNLKAIGSKAALSHFDRHTKGQVLTPSGVMNCLVAAIEDLGINDVGGIPQIVTLDRRGIESFGTIADDDFYIDGFKVDQNKISKRIRFIKHGEVAPARR